MTLTEILIIITLHFISDFVLQDEQEALGKSRSIKSLLTHTIDYSLFFSGSLLCIQFMMGIEPSYGVLYFLIITFIFHTITDYFTSKWVGKRFKQEAPLNLKLDAEWFDIGDVVTADSTGASYIIIEELKNEYKVKLYNKVPNFGAFTRIGLDQLLHYFQLFITYYLIFK